MFSLFLFVAALSFYLGQRVPYWLGILVMKVQNEMILRKIRPTPVNKDKLCKEPHDWFSAQSSIDEKGEYTYVNICKNCGFIPSLGTMATADGLKHIERNQKLLREEESAKNSFAKFEEEEIRFDFEQELNNGLDFQKLVNVYRAGQTMKERFIMYRLYRTENGIVESENE
jgi:hypothetical protein